MLPRWYSLLFTALVLLLFTQESHQGKYERALLARLLENYNPNERPVENDTHTLTVSFGMTLQQILNVNERDQILTTNVWLRFIWYDHYLKWNATENGGIQTIRLPPDQVWTPDVLMYNSADERFDGTFKANVVISSDGSCLWIPPGIIKSTCLINVANYPFDQQACDLKFGSWTYNGFQLNLTKMWPKGDVDNFLPNGEWDLVDIPVNRHDLYYPCCPEPYPDITFTIQMKRRTLYYSFNLIIPCVLMSLLTLLSFTLPPDSGEKLALGITILLSLTVFLLIISEKMPPASVVPLIGVYYALTIIMVGISVVFTIIILNLHHRHPDFYEMSSASRWVLLDFLPTILCMKKPQFRTVPVVRYPNRNEMVRVGNRLANTLTTYDQYQPYGETINIKELHSEDETVGLLPTDTASLLKDTNSILEELKFITTQMRDQDDEGAGINEWKFAGMVIDRLCLVSFSLWTIVNTVYVVVSPPSD
ncbi:neuronal acetylcholine receptor subunit alpha-7-like [Glandiceps talaboti]